MTKILPIAILVALNFSGCSTEEDNGERLLAVPPGEWNKIYQINNNETRITEFVPPDQSEKNWDTKLAFESFRQLVDADPIQVLLAEVEEDKEKCRFVQHFNLFSGLENNYPTSFRLIMCGENTNVEKGEIELIKTIKGNEFFYIIRVLRRIPPFEVNDPDFAKQEIANWSTYFRLIGVCDPSRELHGCPGTQ